MASHLDLEEQEQLDQLKAFWKQYGNLITWVITLALAAYAGWTGWNWYQRDQAVKAAAMFDELERASQAGEADKAGRVFADMKERFPRTVFTQQGALLAAKVQHDKGQADNARATLSWVADNAGEDEYKALAQLRLAGLQMDAKQYDAALKALDGIKGKEFEGLAADRRGDILLAQGKRDEAKAQYQKSFDSLDKALDYRRLVEAKLGSLGVVADAAAVAAAKTASAGASQ
jgi:predicted negative regulator of RcsB-dependent stress response